MNKNLYRLAVLPPDFEGEAKGIKLPKSMGGGWLELQRSNGIMYDGEQYWEQLPVVFLGTDGEPIDGET